MNQIIQSYTINKIVNYYTLNLIFMKLKKIALFVFFIISLFLQPVFGQEIKHCGSTKAEKNILEKYPDLIPEINSLNDYLNSINLSNLEKTRQNKYIIPIVFHVIHNYGIENISDAQIYDAVRILNNDFNLRNSDTVAIVPAFQSLKANVNFEFRLARKDPEGNCTNGIDRIVSYKTYQADDQSKLNPWNRNYYFNVWVVNSIGDEGVAGYAYKPATANYLYYYDGVIILHNYVGSIGTGAMFSSRALTHEIGHCMNLDHTWGGTNNPGVACGDDGVQDTPETKGHDNCNNIVDNTCNPPIIENLQNYMEYAYCPSNMFTLGQKDRMTTAVTVNIAQRKFLVSAQAQYWSGVDQNVMDCAPKADFNVNKQFACIGNAFQFKNQSYNDTINGFNWNFGTNSSPQTSTNTIVNVSFNSTGWKDISLVANSNAGSNTKFKNSYVYVADPTGKNVVGQINSFEDINDYAQWPIFNYFNNNFKWEFYDKGGVYSGGRALRYRGFDDRTAPANYVLSSRGDYDDIISPAFDLSSLTTGNAYLNFMLAGATRANIGGIGDTLIISYSSNCGSSWNKLASYYAGLLINNGTTNVDFEPSSGTSWAGKSISLPGAALTNSTFFKLRYTAGEESNNVYIDNFEINSTPVAIDDKEGNIASIQLVPNPTNNKSFLQIIAKRNTRGTVVVTNAIGQYMYNKSIELKSNEFSEIELAEFLHSGIYYVLINLDGKPITKKLIVN